VVVVARVVVRTSLVHRCTSLPAPSRLWSLLPMLQVVLDDLRQGGGVVGVSGPSWGCNLQKRGENIVVSKKDKKKTYLLF
jgi:hypothetical protein